MGIVLTLSICVMATFSGLDRDRAFYPVLLIVIALYYALFAVMGTSGRAVIAESLFIAAFMLVSVSGFRLNLWFVVVGLSVHGIYDLFHGSLIENPGVPLWWPMFCLTSDITAAGYLSWLILRGRLSAKELVVHHLKSEV